MIHVGASPLHATESREIAGGYVTFDGEQYYRIENYDQMPRFFMTIVSDSNHWMFLSSNGGLTAGRVNPEHALFPYYTDDKIHDSKELTGSKTLLLVKAGGPTQYWEPFSDRYAGVYRTSRNLYKNVCGNKIVFEEINTDLGLTFRYGYFNSDRFGWVRRSELIHHGTSPAEISFIDGWQNILPYGIDTRMQNERSTLLDAYKKNELIESTGLGLFLLSSIPVDKAEPSEALKANTVWSAGLDDITHLISSAQLESFRRGEKVRQETDVRGKRGAYFVHSTLTLQPTDEKQWYLVAELEQGPSQIASLNAQLQNKSQLIAALKKDIEVGTENLKKIVARADGMQCTGSAEASYRHFSNVLFNVMRGGVVLDHYDIRKEDFSDFMQKRNQTVYSEQSAFFESLPDRPSYQQIIDKALSSGHSDLIRNVFEYLPIAFSRRHGDPSRPWNFFSIEVKNEDGSISFNYQGNWRDIFQNWEALAMSFPGFVEGMIFKFVNASTADGYNPYRIYRNGLDWEVVEPNDPWSYIGYWGDHQIIYLLKLMEISQHYHRGKLAGFLNQPFFAFAHVPYRIKSYEEIIENPNDTIVFDHELDAKLRSRTVEKGMDGQLLSSTDGEVVHATFAEKLLITLLAKLSNFIPEAGIWLNTQRPEWNDANNALVGNGVSMVTLYYIRRFLTFCTDLFEDNGASYSISSEVAKWFASTRQIFEENQALLSGAISDEDRKSFTDGVGMAGSDYRLTLYKDGFSGQKGQLTSGQLRSFFQLALNYVDHSIRSNRRNDALYHAYNLIEFKEGNKVSIRRLYEMLEGQVAVLSSGLLSPAEADEMLTALRRSKLYWPEQHSYLLYPDRQLPRFTEKNNIPSEDVERSDLIRQLIEDGNTILVEKDINGVYHFNGSFNNADSVIRALKKLRKEGYGKLVDAEQSKILGIFEKIFDHQSFTGRSGTFFGYEGLGCIYWHMVSKLLLAVEENCLWAIGSGADASLISALIDHYYDVRQGIGFNKTPEEYGAFPSDAYSHTPGDGGAKQPGMTGQVKEDILSRFGELGVRVSDGQLEFKPDLLKKEEFLSNDATFEYYDLSGTKQGMPLHSGQLAFTFNQVPVVYTLSEHPSLKIVKEGEVLEQTSYRLSKEHSAQLFDRSSVIRRIEVHLTLDALAGM